MNIRGVRSFCAFATLLSVMMLLGTSPNANASAWGSLVGHVYGYGVHGETVPVVWARVSARLPSGQVFQVASTGARGFYQILLPPGTYAITAEARTLKAQTKIVSISRENARWDILTELDFYLIASA